MNTVRKEMSSTDFDIIHHITFGKFWIPSRLAGLKKPFVFGPVGGGETTPNALSRTLGLRGKISEIAKAAAILCVRHFPGAGALYRSAAWTFAATPQTEAALANLGVTQMSVLPQSGIRESDLPEAQPKNFTNTPSPLRLVTAARLIHWKGVDLAIEAVAKAAESIDVRLVVLQTGPEMERLKALALRRGIADRVEFKGRLPSLDHVYQEMAASDALIHPALHEAFGQSCLESLALGVPVICLDWAGPGIIVNSETGFAVQPGNRDETIFRLAEAILELAAGPSGKDDFSMRCKQRAFETFGWDKLARSIVAKYQDLSRPEPNSITKF
ncbi:MAG: glycosyltransferase [Verrucomicrobiota bacterium]